MTNFGRGLRVPKPGNPSVYLNDVQSQGDFSEKTYICVVVRRCLGRAGLGSVFARFLERICSRFARSEGEVLEDRSEGWLRGQQRWWRHLRHVGQRVAIRI